MTDDDQRDLFEGRRRRDESIDRVSRNRDMWLARARATAERIAIVKGQVSSDDVRRECPIPDGVDPRILGSVFNARRRGFPFYKAGETQTVYKQAHARPITVWRLRRR